MCVLFVEGGILNFYNPANFLSETISVGSFVAGLIAVDCSHFEVDIGDCSSYFSESN